MTLALCGCPNCGKTTLFNLLTGQSQRTGNWPGVTVQLSEGIISPAFLSQRSAPVRLIDLPGAQTLTPFSPDEKVPLDFLRHTPPDAVIVVIDSCDPAQGLYLTLQLLSLHLPLVVALNMADRLQAEGGNIHVQRLSAALHVPCLLISARQQMHIETLLQAALHAAAAPDAPAFPSPEARWQTIDRLLSRCFSLPNKLPVQRLDKCFTHPIFAYPIFFLVLSIVFFCAFGAPGRMLTQLLEGFFDTAVGSISQLLSHAHTPPLLHALLTDGLMRSMGSVLSFLPVLLLFFFCTALLEDSGYLARAAFILDAPLMRLHLSGRSFFPLITGCGCSVPAVLSTQSLPTEAERRRTALLIPYLPCSAKLPVMLFIAAYCLKMHSFLLIPLCYAACLMILLLIALCLPGRKSAPPLIMDFPILRLPTLRGALRVMQHKTRDFITRAFTLIFFTAVIVWLLQHFTPALQYTLDAQKSLLFHISRLFMPLLSPLGLASPTFAAALLAGLFAKENILSVLSLSPALTLFSSPAAALSFLTFSLLYAPCASACAALSQALKSRRRMLFAVLLQTALAWLAAFFVYRIFL